MPEGQYSGVRRTYIYTSDTDEEYLLTLDQTLGDLAGTGLVVATAANSGNASPAPKRFKPRCVYWQGTLSNRLVRKRLICGTTDATLYDSDSSQNVTIDGVTGSTTGRRGEQLTFGKLAEEAPPG